MSYMPERPWSEPERYQSPPQPPPAAQPAYNYFVSGGMFFRAGIFWGSIGLLALLFAVAAFGGIADQVRGKHIGDGAWNGIAAVFGPLIWLGCWFLSYRAFRNWAEFKKGQMSLIFGRR